MKKVLVLSLTIVLVVSTIVTGVVWQEKRVAKAAGDYVTKSTSTATSTRAYLTAGTATTTLKLDDRGPFSNVQLLVQMTASTTASELRGVPQGSMDGIDWYSIGRFESDSATTTASVDVTSFREFRFDFASSTDGLRGTSFSNSTGELNATSTNFFSVDIPAYTRYVRVLFYVPVGAGASAIWAQLVGRIEF